MLRALLAVLAALAVLVNAAALEPHGAVAFSTLLVDQPLQNDAFLALKTAEANAVSVLVANEGDDDLDVIKVRSVVTDSEGNQLFRAEKNFQGVRVKSNEDLTLPLKIALQRKRASGVSAAPNGRVLVSIVLKDEDGKTYENIVVDKRAMFIVPDETLANALSTVGTLLVAAGVLGVFGLFMALVSLGHESVAKIIESFVSKSTKKTV
jgi:hypothetical protein